jgi:hypothetical protein
MADLTAEPVAGGTTPSPSVSPSPSGSPSTSPSASPSASVSPSPSDTETRPPTDTDRARFVATYSPAGAEDLDHVAADLDGDGQEELVFAYVRVDPAVSHIDVAWWDGREYAVVFGDDGGPASRVDRLRTADVNADGLVEIITNQSATQSAASLTLWQVTAPRTVVDLPAVGGCNAGRSTYGVIGASLEDRDADGSDEVYATCDDSPLPVSAWSTDRYVWRDGAYRYTPDTVE